MCYEAVVSDFVVPIDENDIPMQTQPQQGHSFLVLNLKMKHKCTTYRLSLKNVEFFTLYA